MDFEIEKRTVDTIFLCFTDCAGRLIGARLASDYFSAEALGSGIRVPTYLLGTDAAGAMCPTVAVASPDGGLGSFRLTPDPTTFFRMPWEPSTIGVIGNLTTVDGTPVDIAPREILAQQARRIEASSMSPTVGMEPQFVLLPESGPEPSGGTHLVSRSAAVEATLHRVRRSVMEVPVSIAGSVGLTTPDHYEITLLPGDPVDSCDGSILARTAVREIVAQEGLRATFMAFTGYHAASAGHVSVSLRGLRGSSSFGDRHGEGGLSELGKSFTAGLLAHAAELCVFYAPTANAYRRFGSDILSPSTLTWGVGNRTCAVRADGPETSLRLENRIPGSDANPYLSAAATLAAGLDGVVRQLKAPPETKGNGHDADAPRLPESLDEALAAWEASTWVRETFGGTVQDHYASLARVEVEAADAGDGLEWERARYFDGT